MVIILYNVVKNLLFLIIFENNNLFEEVCGIKKVSKAYLFNIIMSIITLISFWMTIKIDNDSRLPQNINTDYYMNSLPYIYIILFCLFVLILFNLYQTIKNIKKSNIAN